MEESWNDLVQLSPDDPQLANVASVNRWEMLKVAEELGQLEVPRAAAARHREIRDAVQSSARACQLLANGYRFHKADAMCDGHILLLDTMDRLNRLSGNVGGKEDA